MVAESKRQRLSIATSTEFGVALVSELVHDCELLRVTTTPAAQGYTTSLEFRFIEEAGTRKPVNRGLVRRYEIPTFKGTITVRHVGVSERDRNDAGPELLNSIQMTPDLAQITVRLEPAGELRFELEWPNLEMQVTGESLEMIERSEVGLGPLTFFSSERLQYGPEKDD